MILQCIDFADWEHAWGWFFISCWLSVLRMSSCKVWWKGISYQEARIEADLSFFGFLNFLFIYYLYLFIQVTWWWLIIATCKVPQQLAFRNWPTKHFPLTNLKAHSDYLSPSLHWSWILGFNGYATLELLLFVEGFKHQSMEVARSLSFNQAFQRAFIWFQPLANIFQKYPAHVVAWIWKCFVR